MPDRGTRAPARDWYDLVIQTIALRNMTKAQLASRSGVSRATIDRWGKGASRPAQAASVNAVADVLGIDNERALRLAGVIAADPADRSPPVPPELADKPDLVENVRRRFPDPATQQRMLEAMAAAARGGQPPPTEPGEAGQSGEREREAG